MSVDIMELITLVMLEAAEENAADLKEIMDEVRKRNERLCRWRKLIASLAQPIALPLRPGCCTPAPGERCHRRAIATASRILSEEMQMRLQMIMDRRAKFLEALSNIMKKQSDTAAAIVANLK